jgi:hypothetical protein
VMYIDKQSLSSETNEKASKRHHPNALSVQSGILSNATTIRPVGSQ